MMTDSLSPQPGDIVVYRERGTSVGPCTIGSVGRAVRTPAATYATAIREARHLAASSRVDIWTGFRPRWTDVTDQTFKRVAAYRATS